MKTTKKRVFGLIGLLAVGTMTLIAVNLPSPDAAAVDTIDTDLEVQVNVSETGFDATFSKPQDGDVFVDPLIEVTTNYTQVNQIDYYLYYTDQSGQQHKVPVGNYNPTDKSGVYSFTLDLDKYAGFSDYQLESVATGASGATRDDRVNFVYRALDAHYTGTANNADPKFEAEVSSSVEKVQVQVYDKDGKAVFVDASGAEQPIIVSRDQFDGNNLSLTLPFEKYGLADGNYTAVFVAYDKQDNILGIVPVDFNYDKKAGGGTPEVPDTGMSGNLMNISRLDYIFTGLVLFGLASGFAIYLILRKKRH